MKYALVKLIPSLAEIFIELKSCSRPAELSTGVQFPAMAEDKMLSFEFAIIADGSQRLQAISLLYQKYAATKEPMPNEAADTAIRFAEYALGHPEELAAMLQEVIRRSGPNSRP